MNDSERMKADIDRMEANFSPETIREARKRVFDKVPLGLRPGLLEQLERLAEEYPESTTIKAAAEDFRQWMEEDGTRH